MFCRILAISGQDARKRLMLPWMAGHKPVAWESSLQIRTYSTSISAASAQEGTLPTQFDGSIHKSRPFGTRSPIGLFYTIHAFSPVQGEPQMYTACSMITYGQTGQCTRPAHDYSFLKRCRQVAVPNPHYSR